jgi:glycosyltransferase involved in cell wall biosynthesis
MAAAERSLRIGIVASPLVSLPPVGYAGTERVVTTLAHGLNERGHQVTVFTSGDSKLPCEIVPVTPTAIWRTGQSGDLNSYSAMSVLQAWEQSSRFDLMHSHVEASGFGMARHCATPVISTMHSRLDVAGTADLIDLVPDIPLVAISDSQRRWNPDANWVATIHHGLDFADTPFETTSGSYLALVGRLAREKGIVEAIEVARRTGRRLVVAAKVREPEERRMFDDVIRPAIDSGVVDWRGEVDTVERDQILAGAYATLMLGAWPEPFGLVGIESMATGTPVIARRAGGCTETILHGDTGFLVDDVDEAVFAVSRISRIDRDRVARYARRRFAADRMVGLYEQLFLRVARSADSTSRETSLRPRAADASVGTPLDRPASIARAG